jgi:hypothetical protein
VCNTFVDCDDKTDELDCKSSGRQPNSVNEKTTTDVVKVNKLSGKTVNEEVVAKAKEKPKLRPTEDYSDIPYDDDFKLNGLDYDYLTLLQKQAEIVDHLADIENRHSSHNSNRKNDDAFKIPDSFFDSFMKTKSPLPMPTRPYPKMAKTTLRTSSIKPKEKIYWHGIFLKKFYFSCYIKCHIFSIDCF